VADARDAQGVPATELITLLPGERELSNPRIADPYETAIHPTHSYGGELAETLIYAFVMKTPEEIMIERERREVSTSTGRA
jgi:hypothetical protein